MISVFRPITAQDVSEALKIISQDNCRFSIKGHGHAPAAGFANAEGGVTIDLTTLSSVSLNKDSTVASVDAGAKWLDIYRHLSRAGVQVAGGLNGNVGVGGLLLGGGISHFTTRIGWACDQVLNYQDNHADLFVALKGGGNNFGVVTRFDLQTFPAKLFETFTNLLDSSTYDPLASLVTTLVYSTTSKSWSLKSSAVYTKPVTHLESLLMRKIRHHSTFRPSSENMREVFDTLNKTIYTFNPHGGVTWDIAFEPLVAGMLNSSKDRNVLGLKAAEEGYIVLISALWPNSTVDSSIESTARAKFTYLNYAAPYQEPLKSLSKAERRFLRATSQKYDPEQILQRKVGEFKLQTCQEV
ncbi:hypothetical protein BKA59DRAFT_496699 [Fusarium tricinctum]|uniref:FAD-binding PCMH-type domain-containing protein n=1 Tax=Fusarium tricinctum TaxID=61284 RepID=A0A8K0RPL3_9HYPO|nr:hypothetical protein BKA59DRAFT_496699 [Fusarium tricinctum]